MGNSGEQVDDQVVAATLRQVLEGNRTLTLGTCSNDLPWAAGGYFAEDDVFTLAMILEHHGTTMANIRANPVVAVSVTTGNPFEPFAQGRARVEVLAEDDAVAEAHARLRAKNPEMEPLFSIPVETVLVRVATWKVTDIPSGWLPAKVLDAPAAAGV